MKNYVRGFGGRTELRSIRSFVLAPTLACVLDAACVAPPGSNRSNHRQDQTVMNAIMCRHDEDGTRAAETARWGGGSNRFPLCSPEEKFWVDLGSDFKEVKAKEGKLAALTPTADETDWNGIVLLCRREHPVKPYIKHLRKRGI